MDGIRVSFRQAWGENNGGYAQIVIVGKLASNTVQPVQAAPIVLIAVKGHL
jgi:hypothetical protein